MDKLTEIREAYIERLAKVIEVNPGFRIDAVTVQMDVSYLLQLVDEMKEAMDKPRRHLLFELHNERTLKESVRAERDHLAKLVETQAKALEFYADEETYEQQWLDDCERWADPEIEDDCGQRAREALTQV